MFFIDLHQDLVNYFTSNRKFLEMKYSDFFQEECLFRHADLPSYLAAKTKIIFSSVFPLSFTDGRWQAVKSKEEVQKQLNIYQRLIRQFPIFYIIKDAKDIHNNFNYNKIGLLLHMEGTEAIENIGDIQTYYELGVRSVGLTWNLRNRVAGGLGSKAGLTRFGNEVLKELMNFNFILDLTHLNNRSFYQTLEFWNRPLMVSHTAIKRLNNHEQNLDTQQIKEVLKRRGLIGISFLKNFYGKGDINIDQVVEHVEYFKKNYGINNLAIGSDFFGFSLSDNICGLSNIGDIKKLKSSLFQKGWLADELSNMFWRNAYNLIINSLNS